MPSPQLCLPYFWTLCDRPEAWSTWAALLQALLSALAIYAAARLAAGQERRQIARKVDVYATLLDAADNAAVNVIEARNHGFFEVRAAAAEAAPALLQMAAALDSVTLQEVPDFRLVPPLHAAARVCRTMGEQLNKICRMILVPADDTYLVGIVDGQRALVVHFNEVAEISNEYARPTLRQRLRILRMKIRTLRGEKAH